MAVLNLARLRDRLVQALSPWFLGREQDALIEAIRQGGEETLLAVDVDTDALQAQFTNLYSNNGADSIGIADMGNFFSGTSVEDALQQLGPGLTAGPFIPLSQKGVANGVATLDGTGKVPSAQLPPATSVAWGTITGTLSSQTDLQTALNGKANTTHTHIIADVTGLQTALNAKASLGADVSFRDVTAARDATTGAVWLGSGSSGYLYRNGPNSFEFRSGTGLWGLSGGSGNLWHSGNFNPALKLDNSPDPGTNDPNTLSSGVFAGYLRNSTTVNTPELSWTDIYSTMDTSGAWGHQLAHPWFGNDLYIRSRQSGVNSAWYKMWHSGNLTPGNYVLKTGDTMSGSLTNNTAGSQISWQTAADARIMIRPNGAFSYIDAVNGANTAFAAMGMRAASYSFETGAANFQFTPTVGGQSIWHAGNDGAGSGLDADTVDGIDSTRILYGDNASHTIHRPGGDMNVGEGSGFFEYTPGSLNTPVAGAWAWSLNYRHTNLGSLYGWQLANVIGTNDFYVRGVDASTWRGWNKVWTSGSGFIQHPQTIGSTGTLAGLAFDNRSGTARTYTWYATANVVRLDVQGAGSVFTINENGYTNAGNTVIGPWGGSTQYGGVYHNQMAGTDYMIINGGSADNNTYISTMPSTAGNVHIRPNGNVGNFATVFSNTSVTTETAYARRNAAGGGVNTLPRIFVQSGDPGTAAADGDLWFW